MADVSVFIDGFNVYHSLDTGSLKRYKWLDYGRLARSFAQSGYRFGAIRYYTSLAIWNPEKVTRHQFYLKVLTDGGVIPVMGRFKRVEKTLRRNYKDDLQLTAIYQTYEEKHTDVNIAIALVAGALRNEYDVAMLMTGDTDLTPAVQMVKSLCPSKHIHLVVPIGRQAKELSGCVDLSSTISVKTLAACQLSDPYTCQDGQVIRKPSTW